MLDEEASLMDDGADAVRGSYDRVAGEYMARFRDELAHKPLDRALLDAFAEDIGGRGPVGDVGCGPGQISRYLHGRGLQVVGVDLSAEMVALARRWTPEVQFRQGTMLALDAQDGAWAGIVAFYAIVHLAPAQVGIALQEFYRVLRAEGLLLLAFHGGVERIHRDEWLGQQVNLDFHFFTRETIERELREAGFTVEAALERQPYTQVEHPSQRVYLLARKPPGEAQ